MEDRITPYDEGGDIKKGIDEIFASGVDVHFEMMDDDAAFLRVGLDMYHIHATSRGELVVRHIGRGDA